MFVFSATLPVGVGCCCDASFVLCYFGGTHAASAAPTRVIAVYHSPGKQLGSVRHVAPPRAKGNVKIQLLRIPNSVKKTNKTLGPKGCALVVIIIIIIVIIFVLLLVVVVINISCSGSSSGAQYK